MVDEMTDEQFQEMNRKYPSIRTPAHKLYKLGVLAEEHGMSELLMALSQYCGCKMQEAIDTGDKDYALSDWAAMDHLVSAIAHQAWVIFDAAKEEEAEAAAKEAAEKAQVETTHNAPEGKQ